MMAQQKIEKIHSIIIGCMIGVIKPHDAIPRIREICDD